MRYVGLSGVQIALVKAYDQLWEADDASMESLKKEDETQFFMLKQGLRELGEKLRKQLEEEEGNDKR